MDYKKHLGNIPTQKHASSFVHGTEDKITSPILIRNTPIMWGVPMDEVMYSKFFTVFMRNSNIMPWDAFATTESTYLPDARNQIHKAFVEQSDMPYLMMLDSDVMIPPHTVEKLLSHNKPIVGGWYKTKHIKLPPRPVVYDFVSETEYLNWRGRQDRGTGLEKVDGMGAGCWLMSRQVAEALGSTPYDMAKGTEDLVISKKIMDLGFPLYVDWDVECAHLRVEYV